MKTAVRVTSIEAHNSINLNKGEQKVMDAIRKYGPCYDRQLSQLTGLEISSVAGRRNALLKAGLIVEAGEVKSTTNKTVTLWKVREAQPEPVLCERQWMMPV